MQCTLEGNGHKKNLCVFKERCTKKENNMQCSLEDGHLVNCEIPSIKLFPTDKPKTPNKSKRTVETKPKKKTNKKKRKEESEENSDGKEDASGEQEESEPKKKTNDKKRKEESEEKSDGNEDASGEQEESEPKKKTIDKKRKEETAISKKRKLEPIDKKKEEFVRYFSENYKTEDSELLFDSLKSSGMIPLLLFQSDKKDLLCNTAIESIDENEELKNKQKRILKNMLLCTIPQSQDSNNHTIENKQEIKFKKDSKKVDAGKKLKLIDVRYKEIKEIYDCNAIEPMYRINNEENDDIIMVMLHTKLEPMEEEIYNQNIKDANSFIMSVCASFIPLLYVEENFPEEFLSPLKEADPTYFGIRKNLAACFKTEKDNGKKERPIFYIPNNDVQTIKFFLKSFNNVDNPTFSLYLNFLFSRYPKNKRDWDIFSQELGINGIDPFTLKSPFEKRYQDAIFNKNKHHIEKSLVKKY